ncbi:2-oxoglutarate-dependent dioxygenase 19-like [Corylus avellana]|uniref:2-oxoglutarate-dependent dioxygenase 19-like n=1 Tax=Corylus avellana TaxID=13451 RepID=UPI001E2131B0|nr:2-oxoglutarate-dependent dioxygenase 19-like [Corylus avellana]
MAATTPLVSEASHPSPTQFSKTTCVKKLAESPSLTSIPSTYAFTKDPQEDEAVSEDPEDPIPVIDFSLLAYGTPDQRSTIIQELGRACKDWGFFMVINHGVPERLIERVIEGIRGFFDLTEEEKREFEGKNVLDTIRCGTSFNTSLDKVFFWRDFLKVIIQHPHHLHFPNKPAGFSEVSLEYCQRIRGVVRELLKGISESLGLEASYIHKAMNLESAGLQAFVANLYPPCPQPDLAMGLPPHSDHGLLTLVTQNGIGGLQLKRNGKWVNVHALPNSLLVNTSDQLEVVSNGKYKSNVHRAVVNKKATRISLAIVNGPPLDTIIGPSPELVKKESSQPKYIEIKYKDYLGLHQTNKLYGKASLDRIRISNDVM